MEREAVQGNAQRLGKGEGVRLQGSETTRPLRSRGRGLAGNGGGGEIALQVALARPLGVILVDREQAAAAKMPLDPPDRALEHFAHLARLEMPERLPQSLHGYAAAIRTLASHIWGAFRAAIEHRAGYLITQCPAARFLAAAIVVS